MIWRSTAMIVAAFVAAAIAVWFGPELLAQIGLGEFAFLARFCFAILILSVLDLVFRRIPGPRAADTRPPLDH
jgi:integral membrane sensor domain MASE1